MKKIYLLLLTFLTFNLFSQKDSTKLIVDGNGFVGFEKLDTTKYKLPHNNKFDISKLTDTTPKESLKIGSTATFSGSKTDSENTIWNLSVKPTLINQRATSFVIMVDAGNPIRFYYENDTLKIDYNKERIDKNGVYLLNYLETYLKADTIQTLNNKIFYLNNRIKTLELDTALLIPKKVLAESPPAVFNQLLLETDVLINKGKYSDALKNVLLLSGFLGMSIEKLEMSFLIDEMILKIAKKVK